MEQTRFARGVPVRRVGRRVGTLATLAAVLGLAMAPTACDGLRAEDSSPTAIARGTVRAQLPSFAPVIDKVLPAVVDVASTPVPAGEDENGDTDADSSPELAPSPFSDLLNHLFGRQVPSANPTRKVGSGFIIDAAGYIVSSDHTVADARDISVTLQDNTVWPARIVGRDPLSDLALLKISVGHSLPHVDWGDSDRARIGDWVLAVGNPFGLGGTVSAGIISARNRDIHAGPYDDFLQIDAAINRGNSGGPAFNLLGEVIGVSTAIATTSGGSVGIAFAIPSNFAKPLVAELRDHGKVSRGWIGLDLQDVTPALARALGLPKPEGVLVADMTEGGPAAKAGLHQGDVVLSFDGHDIRRLRDLPRLVAAARIGEPANMRIWRKGGTVTLSPVVVETPDSSAVANGAQRNRNAPPLERPLSIFGLSLGTLTPERRLSLQLPAQATGVVVLSVAPRSPLAGSDIAPGDVIVTVNRQAVATPKEAVESLHGALAERGASALVLLNRQGAARFVALSTEVGADAVDSGASPEAPN
jgi:serine protease Do